MNILFFFPEENSYMGQWQKHHIFDELQNNGHSIHLFNPLQYSTFSEANVELIKYINGNKFKIDLFVNSLGSSHLFPETIKQINRIGLKSLLICFDNLHAPFMHKSIAPYFNLVWLTSRETMFMFDSWGCNTVFMPYAANPNVFKPRFDKEISGVGFIGMPYGTRINKINKLLKNDIVCKVYSSSTLSNIKDDVEKTDYCEMLKSAFNLTRFKIGRQVILGALKNRIFFNDSKTLLLSPYLEHNPSVSFDEMSYLYSNLAISLGITELRNTYSLRKPVHKLHLRTFEIPMCGGLQLSSYTEELSEYFENDKEIILYKCDDEMISKTKFYLKPENERLRSKMKDNARFRAENEHSWIRRFNIIFEMLK